MNDYHYSYSHCFKNIITYLLSVLRNQDDLSTGARRVTNDRLVRLGCVHKRESLSNDRLQIAGFKSRNCVCVIRLITFECQCM